MKMNAVKKIFLDLAASITSSKITDVATIGTTVALTPVSPYISIPLLVLAYGACYYKKEKIAEDEQRLELDSSLQRIRNECKTKLEEMRRTQITELEKIINCNLVSKATYEELKELKEFVEETIAHDQKNLDAILEEVNFSNKEIAEISSCSKIIMSCVIRIEGKIDKLDIKFSNIQQGLEELKDQYRNKEELARNSFTREPDVKLSVFSSCMTFPKVRTSYSAIHHDDSMDDAINLILHMIEQGNYMEALQKTEKIFSDMKYQGDYELIAWKHALVACIYYFQYDPKGNNEAQKSEEAFSKTSLKYLPPFLAVLYAKHHIIIDETDVAYSLLNNSITEEYTFEAKALLLSPSKKTVKEDVEYLTPAELESIIINSVLAKKSIIEKDYDNAIIYARKAYCSAKKKSIVPPADVYANALFKKRFPSNVITSGFMRRHVEEEEWPESFDIIELYKECINSLTEFVSSRGKSYFLYNIALVYFVCGKGYEAARYAHKFFDLDEVEEDAIEICAAFLIRNKEIESCISSLEKFEHVLPAGARCLYGLLLMESESRISEGVRILEQIVEVSQCSDAFSIFCAAMRIGQYLLDNNENEKLLILINKTHDKGDLLSYYALSSLECEKSSPEKSNNFLHDLIPYIPEELPARAKAVEILSPIFQRHQLFSELLMLMDSYVPMDEITEIGKVYFNLALKAKDNKKIKTMGESLRRAGIWDQDFLNSEINYTMQYSKFETEDLANACISNMPDVPIKKIITVYRDMAAISTGNFSKYSHEITNYPTLAEIPPKSPCYPYFNIPHLLNMAGLKDDAIKYAYSLYILYSNEPHVRRTLFTVILGQDKDGCITAPDCICDYSAFKYRSLKDNSSHWVVVEKQVIANPNFKTPDDPLVKELWNCTIGHRFKISSFAQDDEYEITEITSKYVTAALLVMNEDASNPESGVTIITTPCDASGNNDVSAIFETAQKINKIQQERIDVATALYHQLNRSIYLFKTLAGFDTLRAIRYFTKKPDISIESANGNIQERNTAISLLKETKKILLSPLSLDLLIILEADSNIDILKILIESGIEIWMSEYLFEDRFSKDFGPISFTKFIDDGQHIGIADDWFEEKCYKVSLKTKEYILEKVKIVTGNLNNNEFSPEEKNNEKGILGRALYHTMLIANANSDIILWDDDSAIIPLFSQSYKWDISHRVFSQAVFLFLKDQKKITPSEYFITMIFLLAINERFTSIDSQVLFEVFFRPGTYGYLRERIGWYFENTLLERISFANILYDSMVTFFTQYTNLQRAKDGFSDFYKCIVKQDSTLVEQVLCKAVLDSLNKDKKKAKPVIKHAISSLQDILSPKIRNAIASLFG